MSSLGRGVLLCVMFLAGCELRIAEHDRNKVVECINSSDRFTYNSNDAKVYVTLGFEHVIVLKDSDGWERKLTSRDAAAWKCRQK